MQALGTSPDGSETERLERIPAGQPIIDLTMASAWGVQVRSE
jgi:hypothetical protein